MAKFYWLCSSKIFLSDKTIAENIAFGLSLEELDIERVKKVCKIASLDNFINEELEKTILQRLEKEV